MYAPLVTNIAAIIGNIIDFVKRVDAVELVTVDTGRILLNMRVEFCTEETIIDLSAKCFSTWTKLVFTNPITVEPEAITIADFCLESKYVLKVILV